MAKCTYIISVSNNEKNIKNLIKSLKELRGKFRKEFIFINNESTDNSFDFLKVEVKSLPNSTIISEHCMSPAVGINNIMDFISGDYIHFVDASDVLDPLSTEKLINACNESENFVAFGKSIPMNLTKVPFENKDKNNEYKIIKSPLSHILDNSIDGIRSIGKSNSLIYTNLLHTIGGVDESVYTHNVSLSLRCSKYSDFVFVNSIVSSNGEQTLFDKKFESHNNIKSIYNFSKENKIICSKLVPNLLGALSKEVCDKRQSLYYKFKSIISKCFKNIDFPNILELYKSEIDKLFRDFHK